MKALAILLAFIVGIGAGWMVAEINSTIRYHQAETYFQELYRP